MGTSLPPKPPAGDRTPDPRASFNQRDVAEAFFVVTTDHQMRPAALRQVMKVVRLIGPNSDDHLLSKPVACQMLNILFVEFEPSDIYLSWLARHFLSVI